MSRLYEAKVDNDKWKLVEINNDCYHSYRLIDKETKEKYTFRNVIGLEQVSENEFLVYKRVDRYDFEIKRYKLQNSESIILFKEVFDKFDFISEDRILFRYTDRGANYRCKGIYSINDNDFVEDGKWLDGDKIDVINDKENDDIKLFVQIEIASYHLGDQELMFTVDPDTLEPSSPCYSLLRDSFINVETKEDILRIEKEDSKYTNIIGDFIFEQNDKCKKMAKEKLLKK